MRVRLTSKGIPFDGQECWGWQLQTFPSLLLFVTITTYHHTPLLYFVKLKSKHEFKVGSRVFMFILTIDWRLVWNCYVVSMSCFELVINNINVFCDWNFQWGRWTPRRINRNRCEALHAIYCMILPLSSLETWRIKKDSFPVCSIHTPQTLSLISHQSSSGFPWQSIDLFWCFLNVNLLGKEEEKERRSKVIQVKST